MDKLTRLLLLPVLAAAIFLGGCGGAPSTHAVRTTPAATVTTPFHAQVVKVCSGLTDTCVVQPAHDADQRLNAVAQARVAGGTSWGGVTGCRIPDVSSYQGTVDWNTAQHYICGAIFKGGEYTQDPTAARNNSELVRLHLWHAMYWFVRDTGCNHEAAQIIALARAFGVTIVANDLEVPAARGYAGCLVAQERRALLIPVDYTGSGTWPGGAGFGGAPLWQAEYGPRLDPFWLPVVAWQCTDGVFGCATFIPGIGQDDVSLNLGILGLGAPPPDPYAIFPTKPVNERSLVLRYIGVREHCTAYRRCVVGGRNLAGYLDHVLRPALKKDAGRIAWLAFHVWGTPAHPRWLNDGGSRFQFELKASSGVLIRVG